LKNKGKISYEKYQGLYGELYFLKEYLSKEEGLDNAILSWVGPDGYSKDFSINDIWYEIKTIGTSSKSVKINSLTQLESSVKGYLVVIVVEKMSNQFILKESTIHFLYRSILESISNNEIKEKFINKVLDYGYIDENLCEECARFDVKSVDFYVVDKRFPKLTRESIKSPAIYEVTYELDLNAIREYKETD
jgi:hypothetical protein